LQKTQKNSLKNLSALRLQAAITTQWLHIAGNLLYHISLWNSSFHFCR